MSSRCFQKASTSSAFMPPYNSLYPLFYTAFTGSRFELKTYRSQNSCSIQAHSLVSRKTLTSQVEQINLFLLACACSQRPPDNKTVLRATTAKTKIACSRSDITKPTPESQNIPQYTGDWKPQMHSLAEKLVKVQRFYDALGGIVGYQLKCLQLICDARVREFSSMVPSAYSSLDGSSLEGSSSEGSETDASSVHSAAGAAVVDDEVEYLVPQGPKFNKGDEGRALAQHAAGAGLRALPELAEIYPLGGTRLNVQSCLIFLLHP